jgi:hypothetical protein
MPRKPSKSSKPKVNADRATFNFGANVARTGGRKRRGQKGGGS